MEVFRSALQLESVGLTDDYLLLGESSLTGDTWDGRVSVYHRLPARITPLAAAPQPHAVAEALWWGASPLCLCDNGDLVCFASHALESPKRVSAHHGLGVAVAVAGESVITAAEDE